MAHVQKIQFVDKMGSDWTGQNDNFMKKLSYFIITLSRT